MASNKRIEKRETIRKIALLNALLHDGKAQMQPVLGKLLAERPHLKLEIQKTISLVAKVIQEVNQLSLEEKRRIVEESWPEALVKKRTEVEKKLPPLPNVEKYKQIVTRFSPNPDCVLHLGSARAIVLSYEYAKMHKGLFYLRFEDTDPKLKRPALPFYDSIRRDLIWLGCEWDADFIQSDRLPVYYEHAERLLQRSHAYVCTCQRKEFRERVTAQKPCPCRDRTPDQHLSRWKRMLDGTYGEAEAVVRVKTDLDHPNPAVRDWPALRIIDTKKYPHPRVGNKYRVWPLYNFSCGVDDHLLGITHIIRGKEHLTNQVRQEFMYRYFGWEYPEAIHYGRLKIFGALLSKSEILRGLRSGLFRHWDDPRLATFSALRRRGITPEAIRRLIIDVGPKAADVVLSWENLYAHNRKNINSTAKRYFFVHDPIELTVKAVPHDFITKLPLHPDHPELGFRPFEIKLVESEAAFWVSNDDANVLKTERVIRLIGLFNIHVESVEEHRIGATFQSEPYEEAKKTSAPLIHWVPIGSDIPCEVVMPDASIADGIAESSCKTLRPDEIIQFERFGFARVDNLDKKLTAYFTHR